MIKEDYSDRVKVGSILKKALHSKMKGLIYHEELI